MRKLPIILVSENISVLIDFSTKLFNYREIMGPAHTRITYHVVPPLKKSVI